MLKPERSIFIFFARDLSAAGYETSFGVWLEVLTQADGSMQNR
jgi:hypothetical protein